MVETAVLVLRHGPAAHPSCEWNYLSQDHGSMVAVTVHGFGSRQQAIVRRLLGDAVYQREVAPKLREVRSVTCNGMRFKAAVGTTVLREYDFPEALS